MLSYNTESPFIKHIFPIGNQFHDQISNPFSGHEGNHSPENLSLYPPPQGHNPFFQLHYPQSLPLFMNLPVRGSFATLFLNHNLVPFLPLGSIHLWNPLPETPPPVKTSSLSRLGRHRCHLVLSRHSRDHPKRPPDMCKIPFGQRNPIRGKWIAFLCLAHSQRTFLQSCHKSLKWLH